jgi:hypothetical protein
MQPRSEDVQTINIASLRAYAPDASMLTQSATTQEVALIPAPMPPAPISNDPNASRSNTVELPIQRAQVTRLKRFALPLVALAILLAFSAGGAVGYGVGKNKAVKVSANAAGWLLTSATVSGASIPATEKVYLSWDIVQNPHDLGAVWYIIDPAKAHPLLATIPIDAASNGQGGITITLHTAGGVIVITGTLSGNTLQLVIPPGSHLFPAAPSAFVTLTFAPSTISAFNQLVAGGVR